MEPLRLDKATIVGIPILAAGGPCTFGHVLQMPTLVGGDVPTHCILILALILMGWSQADVGYSRAQVPDHDEAVITNGVVPTPSTYQWFPKTLKHLLDSFTGAPYTDGSYTTSLVTSCPIGIHLPGICPFWKRYGIMAVGPHQLVGEVLLRLSLCAKWCLLASTQGLSLM